VFAGFIQTPIQTFFKLLPTTVELKLLVIY
jgi:hypothetical protein